MDVGLPDTDGREVVRSLRKGGFKARSFMLDRTRHRLRHHLGSSPAPMIMSPSVSFRVLLARIRASFASMKPVRTRVFVGPIVFRPGSKMLTGANAKKVAADREGTAILSSCTARASFRSRRDAAAGSVGYNSGVTTHTLETILPACAENREGRRQSEILVTEAGGYKLVP